jgi:tetratricopeptide (TPR) repeat protein
VADDIRTLTARLARDPSSLVYAELAEVLRKAGQPEEALRVALQGLQRNPFHADGHDGLARIYADLGDLERARLAWSKALEIAPSHIGALKGVGFLLFRQGDARGASAALEKVLAVDPADQAARRALESVRAALPPSTGAPQPATPQGPAAATDTADPEGRRPTVFSGFDGATADILLLDQRGLVLAGGLVGGDGADVSELAAAALAGVSGEAARTAEHLGLDAWFSIMAEAESANLVVAPVGEGALLLVRRDKSMPIGLALRFAQRARGTAMQWLAGQGA